MSILKEYIYSDLYRYDGRTSFRSLMKTYSKDAMFRVTFWYRLAHHYNICEKNSLLGPISRFKLKKIANRKCMKIPYAATIGYGLRIFYGFMLVIHRDVVIGNNVTLTHNIGIATENGGVPTIGDRVRFGIGAVILGGVTIGDDVVVGANCTVVKDIPNNSVAVGSPARILDHKFTEFANRYYWEPKTISNLKQDLG